MVSIADVKRVYEEWRKHRPRPDLCRFTQDRERLIRDRLKLGYTADDLIVLIRYLNTANTGLAQWMRGENPSGRAYLDLENIFRKGKLGARVEEALLWSESEGPKPETPDLDLGFLGELRE